MSCSRKLRARPFLQLGESYKGYLLRLGMMNGFVNLKQFQNYLGTNRSRRFPHAKLEVALGGRPKDSIVGEYMREPFKKNPEQAFIRKLELDFPRICAQCLSKSPVIERYWSFAVVGRCHYHRTPLLDSCPDCGEALTWDSFLFNGCPACAARWKDYRPSKDIYHAPYMKIESYINEKLIAMLRGEKAIGYLYVCVRKVAYAIVLAARPHDIGWEPLKKMNYIKGYSKLVEQALILCASESQKESWCRQRSVYWKQYNIPFDANSSLNDICLCMEEFEYDAHELRDIPALRLVQYEQGLNKPRHIMMLKTNTPEELHAPLQTFANILGVQLQVIQHFVQESFLEALNPDADVNDQLVDILQCFERLRPLMDRAALHCDCIHFESTSELPDKGMASISELFLDVFEGSLEGYVAYVEQAQIRRLMLKVPVEDYCVWIRKKIKEKCLKPIPFEALKSIGEYSSPETLISYGFRLAMSKNTEILFDEKIVENWLLTQDDNYFLHEIKPANYSCVNEDRIFSVLLPMEDQRELHQLSKKRHPEVKHSQ
ncbi:TniQ family protein [Alginatibacterium sediminis]|uniref:TniQ family protein n=1 Tax=Alginatibacterium sediminis TaxID=2164068 RepID=UPI001313E760|nr:TniQ family protein [Alginatibacterium sediminis]